jgi:hypothetical protein
LGRGLTLDYLSHGLWLVRVTEELFVLPIIKIEIELISSTPLGLLMRALGGPGNGGLIVGVFP